MKKIILIIILCLMGFPAIGMVEVPEFPTHMLVQSAGDVDQYFSSLDFAETYVKDFESESTPFFALVETSTALTFGEELLIDDIIKALELSFVSNKSKEDVKFILDVIEKLKKIKTVR